MSFLCTSSIGIDNRAVAFPGRLIHPIGVATPHVATNPPLHLRFRACSFQIQIQAGVPYCCLPARCESTQPFGLSIALAMPARAPVILTEDEVEMILDMIGPPSGQYARHDAIKDT